jgi:hypothetical protein
MFCVAAEPSPKFERAVDGTGTSDRLLAGFRGVKPSASCLAVKNEFHCVNVGTSPVSRARQDVPPDGTKHGFDCANAGAAADAAHVAATAQAKMNLDEVIQIAFLLEVDMDMEWNGARRSVRETSACHRDLGSPEIGALALPALSRAIEPGGRSRPSFGWHRIK